MLMVKQQFSPKNPKGAISLFSNVEITPKKAREKKNLSFPFVLPRPHLFLALETAMTHIDGLLL